MIRDPSDGSVREKHEGPICKGCGAEFYYDYTPRPNDYSGFCEHCFERPMPTSEPGMTGINPAIASGLPAGSTKPEQIERLNESRKWLKDYHAKKTHGGTDGQ